MAPSLTNMLPTAKLFLTRIITSENTITAFSFLFSLPTLAAIHATDPAWWARTTMANLNAPVNTTIQHLGTRTLTRKFLEPASSSVLVGPTKASNFDELRAGGARPGMAKQQTMVPAIVLQWPSTNVATGMGQNPWIITGRVLQFPTEAEVRFGDVGFGVFHPAFGAVPDGGVGGLVGGDGEASGGACGGEVGGLAGPALDADEVEDGEAEGSA
ncbi:hypothetical protein SESBI_43427 [Sesbania bispinosa]|nr:hypothetical protein SESBI_43427 [Sesbania bispinosa]